jgi:hypothetical protein
MLLFQIKKAPCASEPCQNGATCSDIETAPYFSCNCPADYTGYFCEIGD